MTQILQTQNNGKQLIYRKPLLLFAGRSESGGIIQLSKETEETETMGKHVVHAKDETVQLFAILFPLQKLGTFQHNAIKDAIKKGIWNVEKEDLEFMEGSLCTGGGYLSVLFKTIKGDVIRAWDNSDYFGYVPKAILEAALAIPAYNIIVEPNRAERTYELRPGDLSEPQVENWYKTYESVWKIPIKG